MHYLKDTPLKALTPFFRNSSKQKNLADIMVHKTKIDMTRNPKEILLQYMMPGHGLLTHLPSAPKPNFEKSILKQNFEDAVTLEAHVRKPFRLTL